MLSVDTERRFLPRFENRGSTPRTYQTILHLKKRGSAAIFLGRAGRADKFVRGDGKSERISVA
jgi:hypothetical protein